MQGLSMPWTAGDVAELLSCSSLLSTFIHIVQLHSIIAYPFVYRLLVPVYLNSPVSWQWRECPLSVCPTYFSRIKVFRGKKKLHASLNFQRFLGCIFFILSFAKCNKIVNSGGLMGLGISCMTVKKHGNKCCLLFSSSLKQISPSFHHVFFHPYFCNARCRGCSTFGTLWAWQVSFLLLTIWAQSMQVCTLSPAPPAPKEWTSASCLLHRAIQRVIPLYCWALCDSSFQGPVLGRWPWGEAINEQQFGERLLCKED